MIRPTVLERPSPSTAAPFVGFIDCRGEWQSLDDTPDELAEASAASGVGA